MRHPATRLKLILALCTALATSVIALAPPQPVAAAVCDEVPDDPQNAPCDLMVDVTSPDASELSAAAAIAVQNGGSIVRQRPQLIIVIIPSNQWNNLLAQVNVGQVIIASALDVEPSSGGRTEMVDPVAFGRATVGAVEQTNAAAWHAAGIDGAGVSVGIIDYFGVPQYWDVAEHGPVPVANSTSKCLDYGRDCSGEFFDSQDSGGEHHGVAVVEVVKDLAPNARIYIGQATTLSDYYDLVDWFTSKGVTVINRSLGSRYDGPGDGRGNLDEVAEYAAERGITWVNSAGNNAIGKYYRAEVRLDADDWVLFGDTGTSNRLYFTDRAALGGIRWYTDWDKPGDERTDYDVYLYRGDTLLDASEYGQTLGLPALEILSGVFLPSNGAADLNLRIKYVGGPRPSSDDPDVLEILDYGDGFADHATVAYAASTSIVDSAHPGVVAVGAIDPPSSGQVAVYSSRGPTNDGRISPDVAAPSGYFNTVYGGTFSGTSAAAPVAAGVAALLKSNDPTLTPTDIGNALRDHALDRGVSGPDNSFGYGELRLPLDDLPAPEGTAASVYRALPKPTRIYDSRSTGRFSAGEVRHLSVTGSRGVPSTGVSSVAVNLTIANPVGAGHVQLLPKNQAEVDSYSTLNADAAGQVRANFVIVPVGDDGSISINAAVETDVVIDLLGYFTDVVGPAAAGRFVPLGQPIRAVDSRLTGAPLGSSDDRRVPLPDSLPADEISALVVTLVGTQPTQAGYLQTFPTSQPDVIGTTSTLNLVAGETAANLSIVPTDEDGFSVAGRFIGDGTAHFVVDVVGYFTSISAPASEAGRFIGVQPDRSFDSRSATNGGAMLGDAEVRKLGAAGTIPDDAQAIVWYSTAVRPTLPGFGRAWAEGSPEPATSSFNWASNEIRGSTVIAAASDGQSLFRVEDGPANAGGGLTDLVVDYFGYFTGGS